MRAAARATALAAAAAATAACARAIHAPSMAESSASSASPSTRGGTPSHSGVDPTPDASSRVVSPKQGQGRNLGGGAVRFAPAPPPSGRPDLSLALVQVLCRHGDRTSINPLPNETREHWRKHLPSEQLERSLSAAASPSPPNPTLVDQLFNRAAWHGQLTTQGVAQLTDTGRAMRRWLVDDLALLPSDAATAVNEGRVKVRSTGTKRTVQSAQSLISGLYPELVRGGDASATPIPVEVRERERESMFPNPAMRCARLLELMRKLDKDDRVKAAEAAAWAREGLRATRDAVHARNVETRRKKREEARKKAREMNGGIYSSSSSSSKFGGGAGESAAASVSERPERKKDKKDAHHLKGTDPADAHVPKHLLADPKPPSATAVWEPLQARANHGLPLPPGVGAEDLALIRAAAETRHVHRAASSEAASLAGGRLLRELADEAHAVVEFMRAERGDGAVDDAVVGGFAVPRTQRLSVYSGHDTSIIALLAVLGVFQGEWPPVASTVVLETWTKEAPANGTVHPHWVDRAAGGADDDAAAAAASGSSSGSSIAPDDDGGAAVRVIVNGRAVELPGCVGQDPMHRGGLCSLDAFRAMTEALVPVDYDGACSSAGKTK